MDAATFSELPARSARISPPALQGGAPEATPSCLHCGSPVPGTDQEFCCSGCRAVHELLVDRGLARYYELAGDAVTTVAEAPGATLHTAWLERLEGQLRSGDGVQSAQLEVEGIHCAACVWLMEELFRRVETAGQIVVNPALGKLDLWVSPAFPLTDFVRDIERFGYRVGPPRETRAPASDDLLWRIGVCSALAMNVMMFAVARYLGLSGPGLAKTFMFLELVLALVAFGVGGLVFVRSAWHGLRRGILHLDLPIALGILLGYAGSIGIYLFTASESVFFDTLVIFTTLMLVGRFLRERVIEKNRAALLAENATAALLVRRVGIDERGNEKVTIGPVSELVPGDEFLVAPHDVIPLRARLVSERAQLSFAWITGESDPSQVERGAVVLAGAENVLPSVLRLVALEKFSESRLLPMLKTPVRDERYAESRSSFEQFVSRFWVIFVTLAGAAGFTLHYLQSGSLTVAISVATAILVVTCPCAFGIATPLAYELVLSRLRNSGLLVRSATFLDRIIGVRRVIFDKTGTLTHSRLTASSRSAIEALSDDELGVLYNLAVRSRHPKAAVVAGALSERAPRLLGSFDAIEVPGKGVSVSTAGHEYALGSASWLGLETDADMVFARDGQLLVGLVTRDAVAADALDVLRGLRARGIEIFMATGDKKARADVVAAECEIPQDHVASEATPERKRAFVESFGGAGTLFIGDGINDALAAGASECSGTPTGGRSFLAARTDFYLLQDGLAPVGAALHAGHALRATVKRNLVWAALYNGIALTISLLGLMSPLVCAVLMPASSLVSIGLVIRSLGRKGTSWKS